MLIQQKSDPKSAKPMKREVVSGAGNLGFADVVRDAVALQRLDRGGKVRGWQKLWQKDHAQLE